MKMIALIDTEILIYSTKLLHPDFTCNYLPVGLSYRALFLPAKSQLFDSLPETRMLIA